MAPVDERKEAPASEGVIGRGEGARIGRAPRPQPGRERIMANTIAKATGIDSTRRKHVTRLGSVSAEVEAATWRTFVRAEVRKDGSLFIEVERDGIIVNRYELGAES